MRWWPFRLFLRPPVFLEVIVVDPEWHARDTRVPDIQSFGEDLGELLAREHLGLWTGEGFYLNEPYANIDFEVPLPKLAAAVAALKAKMRQLQVPASTYIQTGKPDRSIYPVYSDTSQPRTD